VKDVLINGCLEREITIPKNAPKCKSPYWDNLERLKKRNTI